MVCLSRFLFNCTRAHPIASPDASTAGQVAPPAPPMPTPPVQEQTPVQIQRIATPPPRAASPRPVIPRPKKKKTLADHAPMPALLRGGGGVPPINVLIVEDNIINLRLLEAFIKRLKVRWQTAMNGREAVTKWRTGGFHLVLMDIQLPIMNGLEATREIRRLERSNSIGAFSSTPATTPGTVSAGRAIKGEDTASALNSLSAKDAGEAAEEDKLQNRELFKSPVIIVALTASSLQSDRHEALAAGCNDFLTKVCGHFPCTYVAPHLT
jgi:osomolarity two-component system, response regulator SSK1